YASSELAQTPRRPASSPRPSRPAEVTVPAPATPPNDMLPSGDNTVPPANPSWVTVPPPGIDASSPLAIVQTSTTSSPAPQPTPTYVIAPRLGVRYNSANTGHEYGYFGVEGFAPLGQTPGNSITFLEGRLLVQQNGALGTNILLGHRVYSPSGDRTYGGYIAYDTRNTGRSFFNQIGLGFETLGDVDARLNVYIPVGNTRNRVAEIFPGTSQFIPAPGIGTNLLLDRRQEFEAAATAVDLEAGGKIAALGDRGTLRAYGGLYYLSPPGSPSAVGIKGRLEALPTDFLNLGVSLQYDGLYNTRAAFTIGLTFPGSAYTNSPNRNTLPKLRGIDRLGESIARQHAIHVADPTITGQRNDDQVLATSPITGNPLRLLLVNQTGGAGGNGTEASPFTDTATAVASATAGDIVFVLANAGAPATGAFTIPAQVAVLSTQSQVPINAVEVNNIQLEAPFLRGAGIAPPVNGTVTMSNDTTLSGFNVNVAGAPGVTATGVTNVLIRDNTIASDTTAAINLDAVSGTANLINNQITGTNVPGINLTNLAGTANITDNQVTGSGGAPALNIATAPGTVNVLNTVLQGNGSPALVAVSIQNLNVTGGQINSTGSPTSGMILDTVDGTATINSPITIDTPAADGITIQNTAGTVNITGSPAQITNTGVEGVLVQNSPGTVNLDGFQIQNAGANGVVAVNSGNLAVRNSTIDTTVFSGVDMQNGTSLTVEGVTVTNPGTAGVAAITVPTVTIRNSTINSAPAGTGFGAVNLNATNNVTIADSNLIGTNDAALIATTSQNISITGGQITSTNSIVEGMALNGVTGTVNITSPISITNPTGDGIFLNNATAGTVNIEPTAGNIVTTGGANFGIRVQASPVPIRFSNFTIDSPALQHLTVDVPSSNVTLTNMTLF
ncbi:MAG: hypothetical protein NZ772_06325, partial [Cyanobacteria bacterium]|nr:hypothetical protein [Cyanobacteriota bacterium]MDW8201130.1 right-handed parallel beta-helix repeat-containing protein [Cyanobacteriota bacterium SKYGB_h_bin112]